MYQSLESPGAWGKAVFAALNFYIIQAAALQSTHSGTLTPESFSVSQYKHRFFPLSTCSGTVQSEVSYSGEWWQKFQCKVLSQSFLLPTDLLQDASSL